MSAPFSQRELEGIERKSFGADGNTIVSWHSQGLGEAFVFVHGAGTSTNLYYHQLNGSLGQKHRCVSIDFPGHGDSSGALRPSTTYTVAKFAEYVTKAVELYGLESAVFVGAGFGAKVLAAAAGSLSRARGFVFVGTDSPSPADPQSYVIAGSAAPGWLAKTIANADGRCALAGAALTQEDVAGIGVPVCLARGIADSEQLLVPPRLWRGAIQSIPGASHLLPFEQPAKFDGILQAFTAECDALPDPELEGVTFGVECLGQEKPSPRKSVLMRKEIPGNTHIQARYEPPNELDTHSNYKPHESQKSDNINARGRAVPGSMPHPNARFELTSPTPVEQPNENPMIMSPNFRGKIIPGTTPHLGARFEIPTDDLLQIIPGPEIRAAAVANPGYRGRIEPGTMPHPAQRFENHVVEPGAARGMFDGPVDEAYLQNPHRGGMNVKTKPHLMAHPSSRFHNNDFEIVDQTQGKQPPGGKSTFIFG